MKMNFLNNVSISSISLIFFIFTVSIFLFFFGIKISAINFLIANIASCLFVSILLRDFKTTFISHIINFIIIYFLAFYFKGTMDFTADGLWYHIPAIDRIINGWIITDLKTLSPNTFFAIENYPKASWVINSVFTKFFSNFEASKLLGGFLIYSSLLFSLLVFLKYKLFDKKLLTFMFAAITAFNTVSVAQSHTFLVDGILSSLIIIMLCALALYAKEEKISFLIIYAFSLALLINVKLTGGVYAGILTVGSLAIIANKAKCTAILRVLVITAVVSAFVLGFNPYVTNIITKHNPVYPLLSAKEKEYFKDQSPLNIRKMPVPIRLLASITAESGGKFDSVRYKIPFSITKRDVSYAGTAQTGTGGFGLLFSGVFLLSLLTLVLLRSEKDYYKLILAVLFLIVSVLINEECWWPRFVPQLTLFPVFILFYAAIKQKWKIAHCLLFVMTLNMIATSGLYALKTTENQAIIRDLTKIVRYFGNVQVDKNDRRIQGIRVRFKNIGVNIEETDGLKCPKNKHLRYSTIPVCIIK